MFVTNQNDSGPGSLRAACEAHGPRIVIFRVSGLIRLTKPITIQNPYLTIAGQTTPGEGVCIRDFPLVIATHDVVVRYLRSRLGDLSRQEEDCISVASGSRDVVLDHCSVSWSIDELLSVSGDVSDVTVQWCLIAESLNRSIHTKGAHGYGSLVRAAGPVSLHHNLWAHNDARNPRLGDNYGAAPYPIIDFRNNVIYNYGSVCTGLTQGILKVNYVANYIRTGPDSVAPSPIQIGSPSRILFFVRGNVLEGDGRLTADNMLLFHAADTDSADQFRITADPFDAPPVNTTSAETAYEAVLAGAGASLRRDAVDARIIDAVRRRGGSLIDSQRQVGEWPEYRSEQPPMDADDDGMPDGWEVAHALDPRDPEDGALDRDNDGYSNVEEYLNSLAPGGAGKPFGWTPYRSSAVRSRLCSRSIRRGRGSYSPRSRPNRSWSH
ncbi:MAG: polysaccharide lyase family 1 protein [Pyrinomonadaceae bacterium]